MVKLSDITSLSLRVTVSVSTVDLVIFVMFNFSRNSRGGQIRKIYFIIALLKKYKVTNSNFREKSENQKFAKI